MGPLHLVKLLKQFKLINMLTFQMHHQEENRDIRSHLNLQMLTQMMILDLMKQYLSFKMRKILILYLEQIKSNCYVRSSQRVG